VPFRPKPGSRTLFRVFNPLLQGEKFDPKGAHMRRRVPELAQLPASQIHLSWGAAPIELKSLGVRSGQAYPEPAIEHGKDRKRAQSPTQSFARIEQTSSSL
jgi:deoxyribodipyrimidine photo-lyase